VTMPRLAEPILPMTLGNMRSLGVRSIAVTCELCHHAAVLSVEPWHDDVPVPLSVGAWRAHVAA
jgi:hypothetical protein